MWKTLTSWYKDWNDEQLAVLLDPQRADDITIPWRKKIAKQLSTLTEIERKQLYQFSVDYQGAKLWLTILKLSVVFSCLGLVLYSVKTKLHWLPAILVANLLGWALVFALVGIWFNYRQIAKRRFRISLSAFMGVLCGFFGFTTLSALVQGKDVWATIWKDGPLVLIVAAVMGAVYVLLIGIVAGWRNQSYETIAAKLALEAEREKNARQESESQLRLLRAQIEPHFLFNTLGAVQQLAEQGAPKAAELTANLIVFLRASMSEMRAEQISLTEEFRLIQAYLEVMKARMGTRLDFELTLPPALAAIPVPSMMLLTLAENAIKHGIEPSLRGGSIHVFAEKLGTDVLITVQDSGVGLSDTPSPGIGLQNVRDRLRLQYGAHASVSITEAEQGGVIVEVTIPLARMLNT
ncbi:sensor histidine kinase [Undibacterium sp.]|uniref:sensor histidine kinase n=1 Tax=Undibacterium sp. TaxID=1914977 RepID=UPI0037515A19